MIGNLVLNSVGLVATLEVRRLEHVPLVLIGVEVVEAEPESYTADKSDDGDNAVVPDEERVAGEGSEGLANGSGDGAHEEVHTHDEGLHVLGGLGVGVLVRGDVGEDLGDTDEDIWQTLSPDVDGSRLGAVVGVITAGRHLIDVVLHDGGGNHGEGGDDETSCHTLDGGEGDADLAETGVEKVIDEGDHDDDGDGVEVLDNIVGDTVELQGGGLGGEVTGHLIVGEEEDREEEEDLAGHETTLNLVDPGVIVGHPERALVNRDVGGLGQIPVESEGLALLLGEDKHAEELGQDGAGWRGKLVVLLVEEENNGGDEEEDGGDEEGQPEGVVLFNVDHGNLTTDGTDIDAEVEVEEDAGVCDGGVDDDTLAVLDLDSHLGVLILLGDEGRDVCLEETGAGAENDETDDEGGKGTVGLDDDTRGRGGDEDDVADGGDGDGDVDGPETTHASISNPGTVDD